MWSKIPAIQSISIIGVAVLNVVTLIPSVQDIILKSGYAIDFRWINLIGFVLFCAIIYWITHDLYKKIQELEDNKPTIRVFPTINHDDYYLDVINYGEKAVFSAQIGIVDSNTNEYQKLQGYNGVWNSTGNDEITIMKAHTASIKIATINRRNNIQNISLFAFDKVNNMIRTIESASWIPNSNDSIIKPEYKLQVTISASPSLKEGSFYKNYDISLSRIKESTRQPDIHHQCIITERR
jgi:hypothetical protein